MTWFRPGGATPPFPRTSIALLVLTILAIGFITLTPGPFARGGLSPWWCLWCGPLNRVELILNVVLFVPLGLAIGLRAYQQSANVAVLLLTPFLVEALQATIIAGRHVSLRDILLNLAGGCLGLMGTRMYTARPRNRRLQRIALACLAVLITLLGVLVLLYVLALGGVPLASEPMP